jgi:SnoaL-like domain
MNIDDDKACIRELIESWVVWRDMGDWERLRGVWHEDGRMAASWREGTADQFIEANRAGWHNGLDILHQLGGSLIEVAGVRALSMTKMVISQRAPIHGVLCDVTAQARHLDRWAKRNGRWGLLERRTVFDRDRIDAVKPGAVVSLDESVLSKFPMNYRHLAYLQTTLGFPVRTDLPHLRSQTAEALYRDDERWLCSGN